jgi:hypothetical protein
MLGARFYFIYILVGPITSGSTKGYAVAIALGYSLLISIPTLAYLTTFKKYFQQAFLVDNVLIASFVAIVAFINLMLLFDRGGSWSEYWYYRVMEIAFPIQLIHYATVVRIMLLTLDWSKWQVIVFKLHLMSNALLFLACGTYFIFVDFSYTNHKN